MRSRMLTIACLAVLCPVAHVDASAQTSIRELLVQYGNNRSETKALGILFNRADASVPELVHLLDDNDEEVSLAAQRVIRYSGNLESVAGLYAWYARRTREVGVISITGPIVLPLRDADYTYIGKYLLMDEDGIFTAEEYLYALALDDSPSAKQMLARVKQGASFRDSSFASHALRAIKTRKPGQVCRRAEDIPRWLPREAFFLSDQDRRYTTARILGYNGEGNKVLVEVYIGRGPLAEEWYNVVLRKGARGWRFVTIHQTGLS